jgi:hypothetical protein
MDEYTCMATITVCRWVCFDENVIMPIDKNIWRHCDVWYVLVIFALQDAHGWCADYSLAVSFLLLTMTPSASPPLLVLWKRECCFCMASFSRPNVIERSWQSTWSTQPLLGPAKTVGISRWDFTTVTSPRACPDDAPDLINPTNVSAPLQFSRMAQCEGRLTRMEPRRIMV